MTAAVVVEKEMGITHADFRRLLPLALGASGFTAVDGGFVFADPSGTTLRIALGPERVRRIALLEMPATTVTLTFEGYSDADREEALRRFERAFQRGGG